MKNSDLFYDRLIRALLLRRRHVSGLRTKESRRAFLRTAIFAGATLPFVPSAFERIVLSNRSTSAELLRLMGNKDRAISKAAQDAYTAFIAPLITEALDRYVGPSSIFVAKSFDDWTVTTIGAPVIPLDLTWGAPKPSDLPHSEIESGGIVAPRRRPRDPWDIS